MKPIIYALKNIYGLTETERNVLMTFVSEERKRRVEKTINRQKSEAILLAESLLKAAAKKEFSLPFSRMTVSRAENGKPYFIDAPNIHFSLSHCSEYVCVALCDRPIGIDIEKIGNFPKKVAERICSERELNSIGESEDPAAAFTKLWTMKEAALKMRGDGLFHGNIRSILSQYSPNSERLDNYWISWVVSP